MMKRTSGLLSALVVATVMLLPGLSVMAAEDQPANNMDIVREKLRADKKLLIAENMQMTEAQAKKFWPVYDSYQKEQTKLGDRMIKLIQDYAKNFETMTDDVAVKLLNEYLAIDADRQALRKSYLPKFRAVLPGTKVTRYYQMENKIQAVVNFELAAQIPLVQ